MSNVLEKNQIKNNYLKINNNNNNNNNKISMLKFLHAA